MLGAAEVAVPETDEVAEGNVEDEMLVATTPIGMVTNKEVFEQSQLVLNPRQQKLLSP